MIGNTHFPRRYIICDRENLLVYCEALSNNHAMAISQGLINGLVVRSDTTIPDDVDFNDEHVVYFNDNGIYLPYQKDILPTWIEERKLVLQRLKVFANMQDLVYKRLGRVDDQVGLGIMEGFVWSELNKCKPEEGYYTHAIEEWAHITEVPVETGYQELLIRSQSLGLVFLRTQATYIKYVSIINQQDSENEIEYAYRNFFNEIYKVAKI